MDDLRGGVDQFAACFFLPFGLATFGDGPASGAFSTELSRPPLKV
jgi:hypothetical protein